VQIWSFKEADAANAKLSAMRSQYLNVSEPPDSAEPLGEGAFVAERSGIRNLVFALDDPAYVGAVSCSEQVCSSDEKLVKLATETQRSLAEGK